MERASLIFLCALLSASSAQGAPTLTSPPPANGASPSGPFVFTFSEPMNPDLSGVDFTDFTTFQILPTDNVWSGGNTVLTCTPNPSFPANRSIVWSAYGENPTGEQLAGSPGGFFTTGGGGGGGSGTNATTVFSVGKILHYNQTSSGPPTLDLSTPYGFSGVTSLASNRTATNITVTLPTSAVSNLTQLPQQPEIWLAYGFSPTLSAFDADFPPGNYSFLAKSTSSNQTVVVNLPTTNVMAQPEAPHLTNYVAAQSVDPNQTFVLGWDAFPAGTTGDFIDVEIGTAYRSPNPGFPGSLNGTARTFAIPAGTLQANSNYLSRVGFFRHAGSTNAAYTADAFRSTYIEFNLITASSSQSPLLLTNAHWTGASFTFDVLCATGQTVTIEFTNRLASGGWAKLLTTNSPGTQFHVVSPAPPPVQFYRARNGP